MKKVVSALLLAFSMTGLHAQMTLEACQEKARAHYPEIRQYDLLEQTRQYSLAQASRA